MADSKTYKIGVVEYIDDWSPFLPAPFDKFDEDSDEDEEEDVGDSSENDEEEDGISDTWIGDQNDNTKEGELRSEPSQINNSTRHEFDVGGWTDNLPPSIMGNKETIIENFEGVDTPNGENGWNPQENNLSKHTQRINAPKMVFKFQSMTVDKCNTDLDPIGPTSPVTYGLLENLVPSDCFRPFPCLNTNIVDPSAKKLNRTDVDAFNVLDLTFSHPADQVDVNPQSENTIAGATMMHTTNPPRSY